VIRKTFRPILLQLCRGLAFVSLFGCGPAISQQAVITQPTPPTPQPAVYFPVLTFAVCDRHTAEMDLAPSATILQTGQPLTITTELRNLGCLPLGIPQYRLETVRSSQEGVFSPAQPEPVTHYLAIGPGQTDRAAFILRAGEPGQAVLKGYASFEVHIGYPGPAYWGASASQPITVTVIGASP